MRYILGYAFAVLTLGSIAANIYNTYLIWKRNYGSSMISVLVAVFGSLAVFFLKGFSGFGISFLLFLIIGIISSALTWQICRLLHVPQEMDWKENWNINISFIDAVNKDEFPPGFDIEISNKGGKKIEGGNLSIYFYEGDKLYCFGLIPDFEFPFNKKIKLLPGEKITRKSLFKEMRFLKADNYSALDFSEFKERLGKTSWKLTASLSDHHASSRAVESAALIYRNP